MFTYRLIYFTIIKLANKEEKLIDNWEEMKWVQKKKPKRKGLRMVRETFIKKSGRDLEN